MHGLSGLPTCCPVTRDSRRLGDSARSRHAVEVQLPALRGWPLLLRADARSLRLLAGALGSQVLLRLQFQKGITVRMQVRHSLSPPKRVALHFLLEGAPRALEVLVIRLLVLRSVEPLMLPDLDVLLELVLPAVRLDLLQVLDQLLLCQVAALLPLRLLREVSGLHPG